MIIEVKNLKKTYPGLKRPAVNGISFVLNRGRTLGILGESGCGKSTLARLMACLLHLDAGEIYLEGEHIQVKNLPAMKQFRKKVQILFQDPFLSLNPKMNIRQILEEPLRLLTGDRDKRSLAKSIHRLIDIVGLSERIYTKYSRELSGGECQRVCMARALGGEPRVLICDEPFSSLDSVSEAMCSNLLLRLQKDQGLGIIFITHDVRSAFHMSDEILIMKDGSVCERLDREVFGWQAKHEYTRSLIKSFI